QRRAEPGCPRVVAAVDPTPDLQGGEDGDNGEAGGDDTEPKHRQAKFDRPVGGRDVDDEDQRLQQHDMGEKRDEQAVIDVPFRGDACAPLLNHHGPRQLKEIKALDWQTPARGSFDPQRFSGALANHHRHRRTSKRQDGGTKEMPEPGRDLPRIRYTSSLRTRRRRRTRTRQTPLPRSSMAASTAGSPRGILETPGGHLEPTARRSTNAFCPIWQRISSSMGGRW